MPIFLAMGGFVIEGGHMFVAKRQIQNAADAAALAAARDLPGGGLACDGTCLTNVLSDVKVYAGYNHFNPSPDFHACADATDTNCFLTPYKGSNDLIQVRGRETVLPVFANALGMGPFKVSASATASADAQTDEVITPSAVSSDQTVPVVLPPTTTVVTTPGGTSTLVISGGEVTTVTPDITTSSVSTMTETLPTSGNGGVGFAMSSECPAITYLGAGGGSVGSLVTNGGINIGGSAKVVDSLAWGKRTTNGCDTITGNGAVTHQIGPFSHQDWPVQPPTKPTPCLDPGTNNPGANWAATHTQGVYCVTGDLQFSANGANYIGYTWFASGSITVSGNSKTFSPFTPPGTAASTRPIFVALTGNLSLQGNGNNVTGSMFAEHGAASISGGGLGAGSGFVEAQTISITGNLASYTGTGGFGAPIVNVTTTTTMITIPGTTTVITTPDTTTVTTTPGGTSTSIIPGTTTTVILPGTTTPGSTTTITTGTTVGLNE
jgi:hypothetical protein